VSGALQKVNKLMTVRSMRSRYVRYGMPWNKPQMFEARYNPEVGDLVVVRILEV
jgi:exosome complex RNA-binding protein Rrp4